MGYIRRYNELWYKFKKFWYNYFLVILYWRLNNFMLDQLICYITFQPLHWTLYALWIKFCLFSDARTNYRPHEFAFFSACKCSCILKRDAYTCFVLYLHGGGKRRNLLTICKKCVLSNVVISNFHNLIYDVDIEYLLHQRFLGIHSYAYENSNLGLCICSISDTQRLYYHTMK